MFYAHRVLSSGQLGKPNGSMVKNLSTNAGHAGDMGRSGEANASELEMRDPFPVS